MSYRETSAGRAENSLTIFDEIRLQHEQHRDLLVRLLDSGTKKDERRQLFIEFKQALEVHARAEELTLYAALIGSKKTVTDARHGVAEHAELGDLVRQLENLNISSSGWMAKAKKLQERAIHHMDEEEAEIFEAASALMTDEESRKMGREFAELLATLDVTVADGN